VRPLYIAVEGIDGSGKTTFAQGLVKYLQESRPTAFIREPGGPTGFGHQIRTIFKDGYAIDETVRTLLLFADRAHHRPLVDDWLGAGVSVVSDRSYLSTLVYQIMHGVDPALVRSLIRHTRLRQPDLFVLVDTPPDLALQRTIARGGADDMGYDRDLEFLREAAARYRQWLVTLREDTSAVRIDGSRPFTAGDYMLALRSADRVEEVAA
jgi:dTMP kinase